MRKIFIDGGGYTGNSVQKFVSAFEGFEIFSFEPNPHLKAHHEKLPSTLIEAAIWIDDGTVEFFLDREDYDGSSVFEHKMYIVNKQKITVPAIDFSRWMKANFSPNDLIILKLDIEGAEYCVLDKMIADGTIDYIDELLIEFHWHKIGMDKQVHEDMLRHLKKHHILPVDWNAIHWERPRAINHDLIYLKSKYPSLIRHPSAAALSAMPLVSVLMSVHNGQAYLQQAMQSIYHQTYRNFEFIIVDDGSTDETPAILERLKDARTTIYRNESNLGLTKSLNIGLRMCRGKYVARMDADDLSLPQRFAKEVEFLETHADIAMVGSAYYRIDGADKPIGRRDVPVDDAAIRLMLKRTCAFGHGTVMARREALLACGGYNEQFIYAQDFDLWLRMSERYKLANLQEPLYCWRSTPECISNRVNDQQKVFHEAALQNARKRAADAVEAQPLTVLATFQRAHAEFQAGRLLEADNLISQFYSKMDYGQLPVRCLVNRPEKPLFSVIIVTCNRPDDLVECCCSLRSQSSDPYELIIVDNGNAAQKAVSAAHGADVYVNCPINFYPSEARNIGASLARGQILVFLDDDALVGPDYLRSIRAAFEKYEILGLRGKILPKTKSAQTLSAIYDLGDKEFTAISNIEGNNAFRRDAWLAVGGMDPLLFGHEGGEFNWRLAKKFDNLSAVMYWPQAIIFHDYGNAEKSEEKQLRYERNNQYIHYKHGLTFQQMAKEIEASSLKPNTSGQLLPPLPGQASQPIQPPAQSAHPEPEHSPEPIPLPAVAQPAPSPDAKVSVIMSCHNAEEFLAETMDSLLAQTLTEWELIVIDDGSTDYTAAMLNAYAAKDPRIRFTRFDDQKGPYVRRNFAIAQARAPFISIQDADDIMVPDKLKKLYTAITSDDRLGIVGSFFRRFRQTFRGEDFADRMDKAISHQQIMEAFPRTWHICWHGSAIIRKSLFDIVGLYDEQPYGSDTFWLSKAGLYGYLTGNVLFANLSHYLTYKREHAGSQTGKISPVDPRCRRHKLETYYLYKLSQIMEQARQNPGLDVAAQLRACTCTDFIPRFGDQFAQWESQPVDDQMCKSVLERATSQFAAEQYVSCLITLDGLEQMTAGRSRRWNNLNLTAALAAYAAGEDQAAQTFLEDEIRVSKKPAAAALLARLRSGSVPQEAWRRRKEIRDYIETQYRKTRPAPAAAPLSDQAADSSGQQAAIAAEFLSRPLPAPRPVPGQPVLNFADSQQ